MSLLGDMGHALPEKLEKEKLEKRFFIIITHVIKLYYYKLFT